MATGRKRAVRPIERSMAEAPRPLAPASRPTRAYPDARTLAAEIRAFAARTIRVAAIPAAGLVAGCNVVSGEVVEGLSPDPFPWPRGEVGQVVEGLRPPREIVPLPGAIPVVNLPPPPPPPPPPTDPIRLGGAMSIVQPPEPEPELEPEPPHKLPGRQSVVQPDPLTRSDVERPPESVTLVPVPRSLSDEALEDALESIR